MDVVVRWRGQIRQTSRIWEEGAEKKKGALKTYSKEPGERKKASTDEEERGKRRRAV